MSRLAGSGQGPNGSDTSSVRACWQSRARDPAARGNGQRSHHVLGNWNAVGIEVLDHATAVPDTTIDDDVHPIPAMLRAATSIGSVSWRRAAGASWSYQASHRQAICLVAPAHSHVHAHRDHWHTDWRPRIELAALLRLKHLPWFRPLFERANALLLQPQPLTGDLGDGS